MFSSALTAVVRILGSSAVWLEDGSCEVEASHFHRSLPVHRRAMRRTEQEKAVSFSWVSSFHLLFYANTDNLPACIVRMVSDRR